MEKRKFLKKRKSRSKKPRPEDRELNALRKRAQEIAEANGMDEGVALHIAAGVLPLELWTKRQEDLRRQEELELEIEQKVAQFASKAMLEPATAVKVLNGAFTLQEYCEQKINKIQRDREAEKLARNESISVHIARMIVAQRFTLEEYKQREAQKQERQQRALNLSETYPEIALATCYKIVDEGVDIEQYIKRRESNLEKRREWYRNYLRQHQDENKPLALYLQKLKNKKALILFSFYDSDAILGNVAGHTPYDIKVKTLKGKIVLKPKLHLKYFCRCSYSEKLLSLLSIDQQLQQAPQLPHANPYERYEIPADLLKEGNKIRVVLGEGEIFTGVVKWFSRYDLKLSLSHTPKATVLILRHAIIAAEAVTSD